MKTAKGHDSMRVVDMKSLRRDISLIPEDVKDKFYANYFSHKEEKLRNQQYAQMLLIRNLARVVMPSDVVKSGRFLIGGRDYAMYELFFRQEPSDYISEPQFIIVACRCFGWNNNSIKENNSFGLDLLNKVYATFDIKKQNKMKWRQFLYLFSILMTPELTCLEHFLWGYAIVASSGYIDFQSTHIVNKAKLTKSNGNQKKNSTTTNNSTNNISNNGNNNIKNNKNSMKMTTSINNNNNDHDDDDDDDEDTLTLHEIKTLYCYPVVIEYWPVIISSIEQAWSCLLLSDLSARQMARKNGVGNDPDLISFNLSMLNKLIQQSTFFASLSNVIEYHCWKDKTVWYTEFEQNMYHPVLFMELKKVRRERRNHTISYQHHLLKIPRVLKQCITVWKQYIQNIYDFQYLMIKIMSRQIRNQVRPVIEKWKMYAVAVVQAEAIQRLVRGFLGRKRVQFIRFLTSRVLMIQPVMRGFSVRIQYRHLRQRRAWAVRTIQRMIRGRLARLQTRSILLAKIDIERRNFYQEKTVWYQKVTNRAAEIIQMCYRRYKALKRVYLRQDMQERIERVHQELDTIQETIRIQTLYHHQQIETFYKKRKLDYENQRLREENTTQQRAKIIALQRIHGKMEKREKRMKMIEVEARAEDIRFQQWSREWDDVVAVRAREREELSRRALSGNPESHSELTLNALLKQKIKKQVKEVLRRADKQKIPMNLPEAQEIAYEEVIKNEVVLETEMARREQAIDNERIHEKQRKKRDDMRTTEEAYKERFKHEAAISIQCMYRQWSARKEIRRRAYKLYIKRYDGKSLHYYYENLVYGVLTWHKPKCFGSYDLDCADGWMCVEDNQNDIDNTTINNSSSGSSSSSSYYAKHSSKSYITSGTYDIPSSSIISSSSGSSSEAKVTAVNLPAIYYYNPKTMNMSWTQPRHTVLCDVCSRQFAMAGMMISSVSHCSASSSGDDDDDDTKADDSVADIHNANAYIKYCHACLYSKTAELIQQQQQVVAVSTTDDDRSSYISSSSSSSASFTMSINNSSSSHNNNNNNNTNSNYNNTINNHTDNTNNNTTTINDHIYLKLFEGHKENSTFDMTLLPVVTWTEYLASLTTTASASSTATSSSSSSSSSKRSSSRSDRLLEVKKLFVSLKMEHDADLANYASQRSSLAFMNDNYNNGYDDDDDDDGISVSVSRRSGRSKSNKSSKSKKSRKSSKKHSRRLSMIHDDDDRYDGGSSSDELNDNDNDDDRSLLGGGVDASHKASSSSSLQKKESYRSSKNNYNNNDDDDDDDVSTAHRSNQYQTNNNNNSNNSYNHHTMTNNSSVKGNNNNNSINNNYNNNSSSSSSSSSSSRSISYSSRKIRICPHCETTSSPDDDDHHTTTNNNNNGNSNSGGNNNITTNINNDNGSSSHTMDNPSSSSSSSSSGLIQREATLHCPDCKSYFCHDCYAIIHKIDNPEFYNHSVIELSLVARSNNDNSNSSSSSRSRGRSNKNANSNNSNSRKTDYDISNSSSSSSGSSSCCNDKNSRGHGKNTIDNNSSTPTTPVLTLPVTSATAAATTTTTAAGGGISAVKSVKERRNGQNSSLRNSNRNNNSDNNNNNRSSSSSSSSGSSRETGSESEGKVRSRERGRDKNDTHILLKKKKKAKRDIKTMMTETKSHDIGNSTGRDGIDENEIENNDSSNNTNHNSNIHFKNDNINNNNDNTSINRKESSSSSFPMISSSSSILKSSLKTTINKSRIIEQDDDDDDDDVNQTSNGLILTAAVEEEGMGHRTTDINDDTNDSNNTNDINSNNNNSSSESESDNTISTTVKKKKKKKKKMMAKKLNKQKKDATTANSNNHDTSNEDDTT